MVRPSPVTRRPQAADALFYGAAADNGEPFSDPNVLTDGNLQWNVPQTDISVNLNNTGVGVSQQATGLASSTNVYSYWFPEDGGEYTNFFMANGIGQTFGLLQQSNGLPTPDPQWPEGLPNVPQGGNNFAINPIDGNEMVISSETGNIFSTSNGGGTWFDIGQPSVFGSPTYFTLALAYGAPDPSAPEGVGNLGNFIYVGTSTGQIWATQVGGGSTTTNGVTTNNWILVGSTANGLDGSPIEQIVTDPARGSHEAYVVTQKGVYVIGNSIPSTSNPTPTWVNISGTGAGNIFKLPYTVNGQSYNPVTDASGKPYDLAQTLTGILANWEYTIPNGSGGTFPVLYVERQFRRIHVDQQWPIVDTFPRYDVWRVDRRGQSAPSRCHQPQHVDRRHRPQYRHAQPGWSLRSEHSDALGGHGGPGRLAGHDLWPRCLRHQPVPMVFPAATALDPSSVSGNAPDGTPLVETATPLIDGLSAITAFGNATRISIVDETPSDPTFGQVIGGFDPSNLAGTNISANWTNSVGDFSIPVNAGVFMTNGLKTVEVYATDDAGSVGNKVTLTFTLNSNNLPQPPPTTSPTVTLAISTSAVKGTTPGTFTFIGTLTSGSSAVTAISNPLGLVAGQTVTGNGIPSGTTIQTIDSIPFGGILTSGSPSITDVNSTAGLVVGQTVTGTGIPTGATIQIIDILTSTVTLTENATQSGAQSFTATAVTLSANATASVTADSIIAATTISVTNQTTPEFTGTVTAGATAVIYEYEYDAVTGAYDIPYASFTPTIALNGSFSFSFSNPGNLENGSFEVYAVASYTLYPLIPATTSNVVFMDIDNVTPAPVGDFRLNPSSDTGTLTVGDNITSARMPQFIGTAPAGDTIELIETGSPIVYGTAIASSTTSYDLNNNPYDFSIQLPNVLTDGQITLQVIVIDAISSNASAPSNSVTVTIVSVASDYNGDSYSDAALYSPDTTTNQGLWLVENTSQVPATPAPPAFWFTTGTAFGPASTIVPFQGDFDGDGKADLAYYDPSTATWYMEDSSQGKVAFVGTLTSGSASVTGVNSTTGLVVGDVVTGTGVPSGTTIQAINSSTATIMLSANATVSGSQSLTATVVKTFTFGTPNSSVPVVGYFDANAPEEVAVYTVANGQGTWSIASGITGLRTVAFGQAGDIPVPGDYTGVGYDELAVYRPATATTPPQFLIQVPGTTTPLVIPLPAGTPDLTSLVPVPGNYDPDLGTIATFTGTLTSGSATVTGLSTTTGLVVGQIVTGTGIPAGTTIGAINISTATITLTENATTSGSQSLTASTWVENTEAAWYDPKTGVYTIQGPTGAYTVSSGFQPGDIPVPADYAGNGSTQPTVFRPSTGQFIAAGGTVIATFGTQASGDIPLAAPLSYRMPADPPSTGTGGGSTGTGTGGSTGTGTGGSTGTGTGGSTGYRHGWFNGDRRHWGIKRHGFDRHGWFDRDRLGWFVGHIVEPAACPKSDFGYGFSQGHPQEGGVASRAEAVPCQKAG